MTKSNENETLLELYLFECNELLRQMEQLVLRSEHETLDETLLNELFRIMHTIKGSSAMFKFTNITSTAHTMEDVLHEIREKKVINIDNTQLVKILLRCKDFIKDEIDKVAGGNSPDGDASSIISEIRTFEAKLKGVQDTTSCSLTQTESAPEDILVEKYVITQNSEAVNPKTYYAKIFFQDGCQMESIRAFTVVRYLREKFNITEQVPYNLNDDTNEALIVKKGLQVIFETDLGYEEVKEMIEKNTVLLKSLELFSVENNHLKPHVSATKQINQNTGNQFISVNVMKLDMLMDITSEIIITEALLTQNPDLLGLKLPNFIKVARQFGKITTELQDIVMSIRMLPISATFHKMNRIVRDTAEKLAKKVELIFSGEETEVDKNIVESLSDPLMHMVRNAVDHAIEDPAERVQKGKPEIGHIRLEAQNVGSEVWISIKDDGRGLDKEKILKKAIENGVTNKTASELTDNDIYSFIFLPGFSTKEVATEYSGRGVGMDVVCKNMEKVHGSVAVDYSSPQGTSITMRIPLTLTIIDGITVAVGRSKYTIPLEAIHEIIRIKPENIILDPDQKEIINIRGNMYSLLRLHERYKLKTEIKALPDGMILVVQANHQKICIFVDKLQGQQQVVVKTLPKYIKKIKGIAGYALLGDGSVSLILDMTKLAE